jgi:hypothetical protein
MFSFSLSLCGLGTDIMEAEGITQAMVDEAKAYEARVMLQDIADGVVEDAQAALHVACSKGYRDVAEALLRLPNVDLEGRDIQWWTPLHTAAFWDSHEVITLLVDMGADLAAKTRIQETPYDLAVDRTTRQLIRGVRTSPHPHRKRDWSDGLCVTERVSGRVRE